MLRFLRKYHKWFSLAATLFILLFAVSGIILNHRHTFSSVDVDRKWLPTGYRYKNWNMAAIKGGEPFGRDSLLVYGNIGVWLADNNLRTFEDFNKGFPPGIDNRKISSVAMGRDRSLYAATYFGLWRFNWDEAQWEEVSLPVDELRVVKVLFRGDSLVVMTRSHIVIQTSRSEKFKIIPVPPALDDDHQTGLFRTLWVIHSGEIYGTAGRLLIDAVGFLFIIISLTGLVYWLAPYFIKRVQGNVKDRIRQFNRFSLRWHNYFGSWAILILLLTTCTGIFLRPPLLIAIANTRVEKIRFSILDNPNPWFDRFRDVVYDGIKHRFIVATSEGIYESGENFNAPLKPFSQQPPVSVMGINVLKPDIRGCFLVGSFNGIFSWNPDNGAVSDYITHEPWVQPEEAGPPFGAVTVAGYLKRPDGKEIIFDYAQGAMTLEPGELIRPMTKEIIRKSPVSLWNLNLEIHTGRIFEPLIGPFYILVVPLVGLSTLIILVSGFFSWWLAKRRRKTMLPSTGM